MKLLLVNDLANLLHFQICNSWNDAADEFAQKMKEGHIDSDTSLHSYSASLLSKDQARANVVREIIQAERDYVKHLHDVLQVNSPLVHSDSSTRTE